MPKVVTREELNASATHPLQTWEWGEFRLKWGNDVVRFPFGQITVHKLYFLPYKIAVFNKGPKPSKKMLQVLREYASKNNILFIKLEPNIVKNSADISILKENGAIPGKTLFTPSTFLIDLTRPEDELLKSFSQKTRYNIRLAQKKGVVIKEDNSTKAFETYWKLSKETAKRQGFFVHTKRYHELMWDTLHKAGIAHILTATFNKEIIVTWVLFMWKDTLYYPYGASSEKYKNVMAPNLMMWEAIKFGKKHKLKYFDLWGREEGKGFTKFKEGYNPQIVEFLGTWDLVCSPLYWGYRIAEYARWKLLRLKARFT
jgi:lipid II:glycine glycyltransferase (peptidoglycan interpeptide bridge formation enzyme)